MSSFLLRCSSICLHHLASSDSPIVSYEIHDLFGMQSNPRPPAFVNGTGNMTHILRLTCTLFRFSTGRRLSDILKWYSAPLSHRLLFLFLSSPLCQCTQVVQGWVHALRVPSWIQTTSIAWGERSVDRKQAIKGELGPHDGVFVTADVRDLFLYHILFFSRI